MPFEYVAAAGLLNEFANIAKTCLELARRSKPASKEEEELAQISLKLQEQLVGAREEILALREQNLELKREAEGLKRAFDAWPEEIREWGDFYKIRDRGSKRWKGPVCPNCYRTRVRVIQMSHAEGSGSDYFCAECKTVYDWGTFQKGDRLNPEEKGDKT